MKLKSGFLLRQVAGEYFVVPSGNELNLNMIITLNDTGRFLWNQLEKGAQEEELVKSLLEEYEVTEEYARRSLSDFLEKLEAHGFITS